VTTISFAILQSTITSGVLRWALFWYFSPYTVTLSHCGFFAIWY